MAAANSSPGDDTVPYPWSVVCIINDEEHELDVGYHIRGRYYNASQECTVASHRLKSPNGSPPYIPHWDFDIVDFPTEALDEENKTVTVYSTNVDAWYQYYYYDPEEYDLVQPANLGWNCHGFAFLRYTWIDDNANLLQYDMDCLWGDPRQQWLAADVFASTWHSVRVEYREHVGEVWRIRTWEKNGMSGYYQKDWYWDDDFPVGSAYKFKSGCVP
jgi:hypothetical protein